MKNKSTLLLSFLIIACIIPTLLLTGCQESGKVADDVSKGPVFYPKSPDIPRIQFLKSFSGPDAEVTHGSAFEAFIVGDDNEADESLIKKPYGFALHDNKIYVCDLAAKSVLIFDLATGELRPMNRDSRMARPGSICIDNGNKYIVDQAAGAIFVYSPADELLAIWGREEGIKPIDARVHGDHLFVLDGTSSQVLVLDKTNGKEIKRLGVKGKEKGQLEYVTCLAIDQEGNIYITDKIKGHITKLDPDGLYLETISFRGLSIHGLSRPKGIDIDKEGRIWVVDSAPNVTKIFNEEGQLLLYFGGGGYLPGDMYLPASIRINYDHIEAFQKYAVADAQIECLIIVSNQYGPNKIAVYGLGTFPAEEARILKMQKEAIQKEKDLEKGVIGSGKTE